MSEQKATGVIIPASSNDRQKLRLMIEEMTHIMADMELKRDSKKDIADKINEDYGIPKKTINKLANTIYKHNYSDIQAENEDFELLYETLIDSSAGKGNGAEVVDINEEEFSALVDDIIGGD